MKILIIENFWLGGRKLTFFEKIMLNTFSILPTLFARQIAAITPKKHKVTLVDERYERIDFEKKYDVVLINFNFSSIPRAYELADKFRSKKIPVVLSGWYTSMQPTDAKKHADSIIIGHNETNWLDLLDDLEKKKLKPVYKKVKFEKSTKIPPTKVDLPGFSITGAVQATRGCPYNCEFCPDVNMPGGSSFFKRPVDDVVEEIKNIPQKTVMFYDDSLTIDKKYSIELFKKLKPLKKRFFCNGNVDVLANDEEFVRLSRQAGCVSWLVGFESVSQKTIDSVNKRSNKIKDYKKAVDNIHKNKMSVIGSFMFGFDTDTKDVFDDTLKMMKELKIDAADFCILTPFIGTPYYKKLEKEKRILTYDWSKYDMKNVIFKPKNMTEDELLAGVKKMYIEFYSFSNSTYRIFKNLRRGFYPFLLVFVRNFITSINSKILFKNQ